MVGNDVTVASKRCDNALISDNEVPNQTRTAECERGHLGRVWGGGVGLSRRPPLFALPLFLVYAKAVLSLSFRMHALHAFVRGINTYFASGFSLEVLYTLPSN